MISEVPGLPLWHCGQFVFESSREYPNPVEAVTLCAVFRSPTGKTREVDGFWDGSKSWIIRFSPDESGDWEYHTSCNDPSNLGLHDQTGRFRCTARQGDTPLEVHGPLKIASDGRYIQHADGLPFFWMADTAWNGPLRSSDEEWHYYLQQRARQKFNVIQWVATQWIAAPKGDCDGRRAYSGTDPIEINPHFFRRLDRKFRDTNRAGFINAPVLLWAAEWGDPQEMAVNPGLSLPASQAIRLARYMVARWAAFHPLWILAGDGDYLGVKAPRWMEIGRSVFARPDHAPVTLHPMGLQDYEGTYSEEKWLGILGYQSCHYTDDRSLDWIVSGPASNRRPTRPVLNLEPCYEDHNIIGGDRKFNADDVRRTLYASLLTSPTAGVSYGGHGVWGWDDGFRPSVGHPQSGLAQDWRRALHLPGADQITHLVDLFSGLPWWCLVPAPGLAVYITAEAHRRPPPIAARSEDGSVAVVYIPQGGRIVIELAGLQPGRSMYWFDPRTGGTVPADDKPQAAGILNTPNEGDWVLVIGGHTGAVLSKS